MVDDAIKYQVANLELATILKRKHSGEDTQTEALDRLIVILDSIQDSFSLSHLTHDLGKFLNIMIGTSEKVSTQMRRLVDILINRFSLTFRPQTRDVLELFKLMISTGRFGYFDSVIRLLNVSFSNQLGNPKTTYQGIASDVLPLLCSAIPVNHLVTHLELIDQLFAHMFVSRSNLVCLSGLLRGTDISTTHTDSKRRKVANYASNLFETLELNKAPSQLYMSILRGYISRVRRSSDSTDGNPDLITEPVSEDESLFFKRLLLTTSDFHSRADLWHEMSRLNVYRLRDDSSSSQRELLNQFLTNDVQTATHADAVWRGLDVVLSVDPVSFSDQVTDVVMAKIFNESISDVGYEMLQHLFRYYSKKGLLHELMKRIIEEMKTRSGVDNVEWAQIFKPVLDHVSGYDLVDCYGLIFDSFHSEKGGENFARNLSRLASPLVGIEGTSRLSETMFASTIETFERFLSLVSKIPIEKNSRKDLSHLILSICDGLRNIKYSRKFPRVVDGDVASEDSVADDPMEEALRFVASKDSSNRASALIRLSAVFRVDVSREEIEACKNSVTQVDLFVGTNRLDKMMMEEKWDFRTDTKDHDDATRAVTTDNSVAAPMDSFESLLEKSREILKKFPRIVFTPLSLRQSDFPEEILATEVVWSNLAGDDEVVRRLKDGVQKGDDVALYGLTVIGEEFRRLKKSAEDVGFEEYLSVIGRFSILAQTRFCLSLPPNRSVAEYLMLLAHELIYTQNFSRDRAVVDCAYFALFQALNVGRDARKTRVPWWIGRIHVVMLTVRGLIGACISGDCDSTKIASANYVVRIWKLITDSVVSQLLYKVSKYFVLMIGEYLRLSHKIETAECADILDRGCCVLLSKLTPEEREHCHALLGRSDRESLKRINELYERSFRYTGKV